MLRNSRTSAPNTVAEKFQRHTMYCQGIVTHDWGADICSHTDHLAIFGWANMLFFSWGFNKLTDILTYLQPHAGWLFGSGGVAAVILSIFKLRKSPSQMKPVTHSSNQEMKGINAGGHVAGGDVHIKSGIGANEIGILSAAIICVVGLILFFIPDNAVNRAANGSAVVTGDNNKTTITIDE